MATYHSGQTGTAMIGGNEVPLKNWNVNPGNRIASTDNSKSGGFVLRESSGGKTAQFGFQIDYDFDASPFSAPTTLVIGQKITNVKLYLHGTAGDYWNFPSAVIETTPMNLQHTGTDMVDVTITCQSDGTFTYPGGTVP